MPIVKKIGSEVNIKNNMQILQICHKSCVSMMLMLFMMSYGKNQIESDLTTSDMKSEEIHFLYY